MSSRTARKERNLMTTASTQSAYGGDLLPDLFPWHGYDVHSILPAGWQENLIEVAQMAERRVLVAEGSVTSREAPGTRRPVWTVDGNAVAQRAPWLEKMYHGPFLTLMQRLYPDEKVMTAANQISGVNLNVQYRLGGRGDLVVANSGDVLAEDVEENATRIWPFAGHFIAFQAQRNTHFVAGDEPGEGHVDSNPIAGNMYVTGLLDWLADPSLPRIAAVMNFYTREWPEDRCRPGDLNKHLFGTA